MVAAFAITVRAMTDTDKPIAEFKAMTVTSKKITVAVYVDRVEVRSKHAWPSPKYDLDTIPLQSVSAISSNSDGLAFQRVTVASSGGATDIKLKRADAERFTSLVRSMMT